MLTPMTISRVDAGIIAKAEPPEGWQDTNSTSVSTITMTFKENSLIPLRGEDYPALVRLWDNDVDAIYDRI